MADELAAKRKTRAAASTGAHLDKLQDSFLFSLDQRNLSPRTVEVYNRTLCQFLTHIYKHGGPDTVEQISADQIRAFLADETDRTSAVSAHQHYRNLKVIFKWLIREGERTQPDPMLRVDAPKTSEKVKGIISEDDLRKLVRTCEGGDERRRFEQRRDAAILSVLIDTGTRVSGVANMRVADVTLSQRDPQIKVVLKGGDEHLIPLGRTTVAAVDRYMRARARHPAAGSPWLWLGLRGTSSAHFTTTGIQSMLKRRCDQAGIERVTPHAFRRTAAHDLLAAGANEYDVMNIAGWKTAEMVRKYAGALAAERARATHARISPRDRLGK